MRKLVPLMLLAVAATGCSSDVNYRRVPYSQVYIPFTTAGEWTVWGVSGALQSRRFIRVDAVPNGYPYTVQTYTGYGGVLLVCDAYGSLMAFDLCCPVECQPKVRIAVDSETNYAKCSKCGSTYDVFDLTGSGGGTPVSGPAAESDYGLRRYAVTFANSENRYALITN
jgi:hypothetical protein